MDFAKEFFGVEDITQVSDEAIVAKALEFRAKYKLPSYEGTKPAAKKGAKGAKKTKTPSKNKTDAIDDLFSQAMNKLQKDTK